MTIPENEPVVSGPYTGNGVARNFDYDYRIYAEDELRVVSTRDGVDTELVEFIDYSVSGAGDVGGGFITTTDPLAFGTTLLIHQNVPISQERNFGSQSTLDLAHLTTALDKLTSIARALSSTVGRAIRAPLGANGFVIQPGNDGDYVSFNSDGDLVPTPAPAGSGDLAQNDLDDAVDLARAWAADPDVIADGLSSSRVYAEQAAQVFADAPSLVPAYQTEYDTAFAAWVPDQ